MELKEKNLPVIKDILRKISEGGVFVESDYYKKYGLELVVSSRILVENYTGLRTWGYGYAAIDREKTKLHLDSNYYENLIANQNVEQAKVIDDEHKKSQKTDLEIEVLKAKIRDYKWTKIKANISFVTSILLAIIAIYNFIKFIFC